MNQTNTIVMIVVSVCVWTCALRAPISVGMISYPADQTITSGHNESCDLSHSNEVP
jgi:hypothetical protein